MYKPHPGLGLEGLYTGLMYSRVSLHLSAHFLSAINLEQMLCSEWLLINYVRPHALGSRSWLHFLTLFTFKIIVFFLIFQICFKNPLFVRWKTASNKSSWMRVCCGWPLSPTPKLLAVSPDFPRRLCPVFRTVFGFGLWQEKQTLSVNLNRGGKGFCKISAVIACVGGARVGRCAEWTLEPLPEELKISMVELGVGRYDCQDGKVTRRWHWHSGLAAGDPQSAGCRKQTESDYRDQSHVRQSSRCPDLGLCVVPRKAMGYVLNRMMPIVTVTFQAFAVSFWW